MSIFWLKIFHSCFLKFLSRACRAFINLISLYIFDFFFQHWLPTQHVLTVLKSPTRSVSWSFTFPNVTSHTLLSTPPYLSILWLKKKKKKLCKTIKPLSFQQNFYYFFFQSMLLDVSWFMYMPELERLPFQCGYLLTCLIILLNCGIIEDRAIFSYFCILNI